MADHESVRDRLSVRVGIVGGVSAGKSTLLNAILNQQLSDTKIRRTTMVPQVYCETTLSDRLFDNTAHQIRQANREVNEAIQSDEHKLTHESCQPIYYHVPKMYDVLNLVPGVRLDIFDIPGLNDAKTADIYLSYLDNQLPYLDVVLVVVDIKESFNTDGSVRVLDRIAQHAQAHPQRRLNVLVVANKCDDMEMEDPSDPSSDDVKCTDDELKEMYHQVQQTVREKLLHVGNVEWEVLPMSAEDSFVYRMIQSDSGEFHVDRLEAKLLNRLGSTEFGRRRWNSFSDTQKHEELQSFLTDTNVEDALKLSGFATLRTHLGRAVDAPRQYEIVKSVIEYRLSKLPQLETYTELPAIVAAYTVHGEAAVAMDAAFSTADVNIGFALPNETSNLVACHLMAQVEKMWSGEGGMVVVDCDSQAEHLEEMKAAFVSLMGMLEVPFEAVTSLLLALVVTIKEWLARWYTSLLQLDSTYLPKHGTALVRRCTIWQAIPCYHVLPFEWDRLVVLFTKLSENDFDNLSVLLPEVHAKLLQHMCTSENHGVSTQADHPLVGYCLWMKKLLPQVPVDAWCNLAKDYMEKLTSLPPPSQFDPAIVVMRTTLDRELNHIDVDIHTEDFESYLLGLKCVNWCGMKRMGEAWSEDLILGQCGVMRLSRDEKRRTVSLFALVLVMELNALSRNREACSLRTPHPLAQAAESA
jgi:GTPase SAR1 family protein